MNKTISGNTFLHAKITFVSWLSTGFKQSKRSNRSEHSKGILNSNFGEKNNEETLNLISDSGLHVYSPVTAVKKRQDKTSFTDTIRKGLICFTVIVN